MMGLGYLGSSSSSSSSNLSPLAPPFTVNRPNHNKHGLNSNTVSNFNDPSYAFSQSIGGQEFIGDSSKNTHDYRHIVSDPVVSSPTTHNWGGLNSNGSGQITHWSHWSIVNPSPKHVGDSLLFNQTEAKPFDRPYPISSPVNVDDIPLVSFSDETDYTLNLSGLEYNPKSNFNAKQEGISSTLMRGEKPVERMENDNIGSSFAYKCLNQGAYCNETLSKGKDDPSMLYYADMIRKANNNGKSPSDGTSFFANNQHRLDSNEFSIEELHFRAFPVSPVQSAEDPFGNSQKLTPLYEKRNHHMFEDHVLKQSKKSSSIVIKSPAAAVSGLSASSKNAAGVSNISDVVGSNHTSLKEKEPHLPQLSLQMGTADAAPLSVEDTKLPYASDQLIFEFKAKPSSLQVPDINIPDAANSFDHQYPAEDSPCWKGTPSLPFGSPENQPPTKKLQKGINLQETDNTHAKTSSSAIPFHNDTGEVVDSLKVRDGGDDVNKPNKPQTSKMNIPNIEEAAILLAEMNGEVADNKLRASVLVKALYNLSDLLLRACSNEALNEHDHEALDHVTRNLGVCMSRKVQMAAAPTNKSTVLHSNISHDVSNETCSTLQDGGQHAYYQRMKSDIFGESLKNLREHASRRDLDSPKGDNMVQAIKKILDENLECEAEVSSETTPLYKDLWLEAEAELCCLSYRARFERLKRETQKEKPHNSTATSDRKETLKSCNGSTFIKADAAKVLNTQHIDDIINIHGEQNPVKEGHITGVKDTGSGVTVQHQLCKDDDNCDDVDSWVIARLDTLKNRGELNAIDLEEQACGEVKVNHLQDQEAAAVGSGSGSDWENILKDEVSWRLS